MNRVSWWLAEVDRYDNAKLIDGAHPDRAGADKAAFLFDQLGLTNGRKLAVARVELSDPQPSSKGVNMEAVAQCQAMGLRPDGAVSAGAHGEAK